MARFALKPLIPRLKAGHPLTRGLILFYMCNEGQGLVLRNLAPNAPAGDGLLAGFSNQTWRKDDTVNPSVSLEGLSGATTNGSFRGGALPNTGANHSIEMRIQPRGATDGSNYTLRSAFSAHFGMAGSGDAGNNGKLKYGVDFLFDTFSTTAMNNTSTNRSWYHWHLLHNNSGGGTGGNMYLEGTLDATYNAGTFGAGVAFDELFNASNDIVGLVDFLRMWQNRILTPMEIAELVRDPYGMLEPGRRWFFLGGLAAGGPKPRAQALIF